jgi:membrane-anchored protein YejM (alkaline phosphatase superfamily)
MRAETPTRRALLRWTGWFLFGNVWLIALVSLRNLAVLEAPRGFLPHLFGVLMFVGQSALLAYLPALLLVPLALARPRRRLQSSAALLLSSFIVFAALIDTVIFQQYRFHLNAKVYTLLFGGAAGEIFFFSLSMYLQSALVILVIVVLELVWGRLLWRRIDAGSGLARGRTLALALLAVFLAQAGLHAWADVRGYIPITRQTRTLLAYVPLTAEKLFKRFGVNATRSHDALRRADRGTNLNYPRSPLRCEPRNELPNVLLVIIDGWRADALTEQITPHAASIAASSLRFEDHIAGGSATRTSMFSLFYSLPGTYWHAMLSEQRGPVLIDELLGNDYEIDIFASANLVNPEFDRTIFAEVPGLRLRSEGKRPSERDIDANRDFIEFLERRAPERPFFSVLFYDAPHAYDLPDDAPRPFQPSWETVNYLALKPDSDPLPFRNLYLNSVHFNDALIGEVLAALEHHELTDETVLLITGDHGQEFNDNGLNYWGHNSNFSPAQVAVPLVIRWPGREPRRYTHRTSHFDVAPTLLRELLGCTTPPEEYGVGRSLLEPGGREWLLLANYSDYALVSDERIIAVSTYGLELLDMRYRTVENEEPDRGAILEALRIRGRFYR